MSDRMKFHCRTPLGLETLHDGAGRRVTRRRYCQRPVPTREAVCWQHEAYGPTKRAKAAETARLVRGTLMSGLGRRTR